MQIAGFPARDALVMFADITGVPIETRWDVLEAAGVRPDKRVTLRLGDVTFGQALRRLPTTWVAKASP